MAKKADRPELPAPRRVLEPLNWHGQPERICGNCEHFKNNRECHNGISGCFTTKASNKACARGFYPCTTRFPIEKIFHEQQDRT